MLKRIANRWGHHFKVDKLSEFFFYSSKLAWKSSWEWVPFSYCFCWLFGGLLLNVSFDIGSTSNSNPLKLKRKRSHLLTWLQQVESRLADVLKAINSNGLFRCVPVVLECPCCLDRILLRANVFFLPYSITSFVNLKPIAFLTKELEHYFCCC